MKNLILLLSLFISTQVSATDRTTITHNPLPESRYSTPAPTSFLFLRGHKQGRGHSLQWSMNSNNGIQQFKVEFTYEDPYDPYSNWYTAGWVNNFNQNIFKYTDMGCLPGIINYRVTAILSNNAGTVVSPIYTCTISQ